MDLSLPSAISKDSYRDLDFEGNQKGITLYKQQENYLLY
jgi:hypothetical protein